MNVTFFLLFLFALQDLHIDTAHISRYLSTVSPAPEQHFHPSALSFDIINLMETGIVTATYLGAQHQVNARTYLIGKLCKILIK